MTREHRVGVILSGGRSARMGSPKALVEDSQGRTLLERGVRALRAAGVREILVVTGFHPAAIAREAQRLGASPVHNRLFDRGQWSSVRRGLRAALERDADRVLIGPVDLPGASREALRAVLSSRAEVVVPCYRGERGHPIGLSALAAARLLADRSSPHLRAALEASGLSTEEVEVRDPQILAVLNTPGEFRRWLMSGSR